MKPTLDPLVFFQREYEEVTSALPFSAASINEAEAWQKKARAHLQKLLGDLPRISGPVASRVLEERRFPGYTRTRLELELRPGLLAIAYYLLPDNRPKKGPAVLVLPGHCGSVDILVGGPNGDDRQLSDYALQCVLAGLPTLALEQIAFGYRRHQAAIDESPDGGTACNIPTGAALMLGRTLVGYRVAGCSEGARLAFCST